MISLLRMKALLMQEWYISKRALEIIVDILFFAVIDILVFGYASVYLLGTTESIAGKYLLFGALWWEVIRIAQYSMTVGSLWNIWSRNLSNMFIAPISLVEFLLSQMLSGFLKSLVVLLVVLVPIVSTVFHFNIFSIGIPMVVAMYLNLTIFSISIGLILLGTIFRYGTRVQALGWAFIFIFQPLCAVFFPVSVLPPMLQKIASIFPLTYAFEGGRAALQGLSTAWEYQITAFVLNTVYFVIALYIFKRLFYVAQDSGQFVRNES